MPRKERTNAKTWERDRRNRMNSYFKTLSELLPPHQEGRKRNKVDILIHASKYIKDLTNRTEELFYAHAVDAHKEELNRLKKLVAQLYSRTQLLSTLLKEAGITVPAEPALEKISPLKWSNKINVDDVDKYLDKYNECTKPEKRKNKSIGLCVPSKKKSTGTTSSKKPTPEKASASSKTPSEDQENHVDPSLNDTGSSPALETPSNASEVRKNCPQVSANDTISSGSTGPKSGPGIRKLESRKKTKRKKKVTKNDIKGQSVAELQGQTQSIGNLMPGTLILSSGKIVPLMTPIAPLTSNILVNAQSQSTNSIILGNTQANPMIVMQSIGNGLQHPIVPVRNQNLVKTVQKVTLNTVPSIHASVGITSQDWVSNVRTIVEATKIGGRKGILPKGKEITKTTMTYKVPIPAVHKESSLKNADNNFSEKIDGKMKIKKTSKNKKIKEKESVDKEDKKSDKNVNIDEKCKKRKINSDDSECSPPKIIKSTLPETCVSIENLRHVVEKIGEVASQCDKVKKSEGNTELNENTIKSSSEGSEESGSGAEILEKIAETSPNGGLNESVDADPIPSVLDENPPKSCESSPVNPRDRVTDAKVSSFDHLHPKDSSTPTNSSLAEVDKVIAEAEVELGKSKEDDCDLGTRFDNLLSVTSEAQAVEDNGSMVDSGKIILNLDTNTTTTMKSESNLPTDSTNSTSPSTVADEIPKIDEKSKEITSKSHAYSSVNSFVPIARNEALHSDLSNDLFASLQVPSSSHNPESISPTAAFLMAFPLVSSLNGRTEVLEEEIKEDLKYHSQTPPMLLQIGAIEPTRFKTKLNNDEKCQDHNRDKERTECPTDNKVLEQSKALPKIINNEPMKERIYKVIPYSESSMNIFTNSSIISTTNVITNPIFTHSELQIKKINPNQLDNNSNNLQAPLKHDEQPRKSQKTETNVCTNATSVSSITSIASITSIPPSIPSISSITSSRTVHLSSDVNQPPKYDSNIRYPAIPEFVPNYSTFSTENQMISPSASRISYSTPQISSQPVYSYGLEKNQLPTPCQTFVNRNKNVSTIENQTPTYTISQAKPTSTDHQDYQNKNINSVMPVSSQSLQYDYARPKEAYPLQHQNSQRLYVDQIKDTSMCSHSTYSMHKESGTQMTYQDYTIVPPKNSTTLESNSSQLTRSYIPSRTNDTQPSSIKDQPTQNTYQSYLSINQTKDNNQRANEIQPQSLPQNYTNQTKQTSIDTFDNIQRDFNSTRKDSFVPSTTSSTKHSKNNQTDQRIETSISSAPSKVSPGNFTHNYPNFDTKNKDNGSTVLVTDPIYQVKRQDTQTYVPYHREQKKPFENPQQTQIKSHIQPSLPRYPQQLQQQPQQAQLQQQPQQQQHTTVTTSNYGPSTITENLGKSTTTVAHNSSNFSILSWTTLSPIGLGSGNNNLAQYEGPAEHVDENEGKTICENFNYNHLHKENIGFGNIMTNEPYPTADSIPGGDKLKAKLPHDGNKHNYQDTKAKNVQAITQQKQTNRTNNQNPTIADDFKYSGDNKTKAKYSIDSAYTQTDFVNLDQRHQHTAKSHQIPQSKPDKPSYSIPYDSQISFDIPDPVIQTKCSDIYSGANYKYGDDKDHHSQIKYQQILQSQPPVIGNENVPYNTAKPNSQQQQQQQQQQQNLNKSKSVQQQVQQPVRPPVNWMMTPEVKHNTNITDLILPPIGKELEFCQNNIFSQTPSYNQTASNQFYNNYDVSTSAGHSFPNVTTLQSDRFYPEEQPFTWSPTKNPQNGTTDHAQTMKTIDQQVVPSTLPTLVGDLALGTNISEKQNFLFGQMPPRPTNELQKASGKDKESNFQVMNSQTVQHSNQGTSFLSVSQLVEHEKAEKSHQQQNHQPHHQHPQAPPPPQPRKHQRKSNTSPRSTGKRQMDMRKQSNDQMQQQSEEQKVTPTHTFTDQSYQQQQPQKYQQNDALWRNRNCKSNYTAEALIGVNNSIPDGNNPDKQLHAPAIKFSTDYSQNKFPSGIATSEMVMPPINYLTNPEDGNGYGQVMNQNFNHSSYTYSPNTNIYPNTNFIAGISNTPSSYMMPLHENPTDYLETNSFLLPNVTNLPPTSKSAVNTSSSVSAVSTTRSAATISTLANVKNQHSYNNNNVKHQNCDKRNAYPNVTKKSKRKSDTNVQNSEFTTIGSVSAPMEDYHSHHHAHPTTFLPPPSHPNSLYQNHTIPNTNRARGGSSSGSGNSVAMAHHPSGTSLTNFNLSTIFPEINDKVTGYKPPNAIQPGLSQSSNHPPSSYPQRANYTSNNSLGHVPQASEAGQFTTDLPVPPPSVLHYKTT